MPADPARGALKAGVARKVSAEGGGAMSADEGGNYQRLLDDDGVFSEGDLSPSRFFRKAATADPNHYAGALPPLAATSSLRPRSMTLARIFRVLSPL